jgi:hypothetical protein
LQFSIDHPFVEKQRINAQQPSHYRQVRVILGDLGVVACSPRFLHDFHVAKVQQCRENRKYL